MSDGSSAIVGVERVDLSCVSDGELRQRGRAECLRELPAFDPRELDVDASAVRLLAHASAIPMALCGVLAVVAAVAGHDLVPALVAAAITAALPLCLYADTRVPHALQNIRRGRHGAAQRALAAVACSQRQRPMTRQRARVALAALAWRTGDGEALLRWIAAAADAEREQFNAETSQRFAILASEVLVTARRGDVTRATALFSELPHAPPGDAVARLWRIHLALLVAFVGDDVDRVRAELDRWSDVVAELDEVGATSALLAWAFFASGRHADAQPWANRARARDGTDFIARVYPVLARALAAIDRPGHWARR